MKSIGALIFLVGCCIILVWYAEGIPNRTESAWSEPANLGSIINSPYNETFPMLSPDGRSLYFASNRLEGLADSGATGFEALDIYVTTRAGTETAWNKPIHLEPPVNTPYADHSVAFSPDGNRMYFASTRPSTDGCGKHDLYVSYRKDTGDVQGWEKPINLGCKVNSAADDSCPFFYVDETTGQIRLYFVSTRRGGSGSWDVYVTQFDKQTNTFGEPVRVEGINSPAFDGHFDAREGMLWSGNKKGYGGGDLWISKQNGAGDWSAPVNMGPPINTEHNDGCFSLSHNGTSLYFTSDRPGGSGGYDLYRSTKPEDSDSR